MPNQQLIEYLKKEFDKGFSAHELKQTLLKHGYDEQTIEKAINYIQQQEFGTDQNSSQQSHDLKEVKSQHEDDFDSEDNKTSEAEQKVKPIKRGSNDYPIRERNPILVAILPFITFGLYSLYWYIDTSRELQNHVDSPNPWLLLLGLTGIGIYVYNYLYSKALADFSNASKVSTFLLLSLLPPVGMYIAQTSINKKSTF